MDISNNSSGFHEEQSPNSPNNSIASDESVNNEERPIIIQNTLFDRYMKNKQNKLRKRKHKNSTCNSTNIDNTIISNDGKNDNGPTTIVLTSNNAWDGTKKFNDINTFLNDDDDDNNEEDTIDGRKRLPSLNILPNTTCYITRKLEEEFLRKKNLKKFNIDDLAKDNCIKTIIHSRTLDSYFVHEFKVNGYNNNFTNNTDRGNDDDYDSKDNSLRVKDFDIFEQTGHTLTIDYQLSFVRTFALDLDCLCRKQTNFKHLNETLAIEILNYSEALISERLNLKKNKKSFQLILFQSAEKNVNGQKVACGFHIYSNLSMSMFLHLELCEIIKTKFTQSYVIIEIPSRMPLPYSAKETYYPYTSASYNVPNIKLTATNYIDRYECLTVLHNQDEHIVAKINRQQKLTPIYLTIQVKLNVDIRNLPMFIKIKDVEYYDLYEYLKEPFDAFIKHYNESYNTINCSKMMEIQELGNRTTEEQREENENDIYETFSQFSSSDTKEAVELLTSEEFNEKFVQFMDDFNQNFFSQNTTYINDFATETTSKNLPNFYEFSKISSDNDCLYLQHYIVALHKYLYPINIQDMKKILKFIYIKYYYGDRMKNFKHNDDDEYEENDDGYCGDTSSSNGSSNNNGNENIIDKTKDLNENFYRNNLVKTFIDYYTEDTYNAYTDTGNVILKYLSYLFIHRISVNSKMNDTINRILCEYMNVQNVYTWNAKYITLKGPEKLLNRQTLLDFYIDIMSKLQYIIFYNNEWFVFSDYGIYTPMHFSKLPVLSTWIKTDSDTQRCVEMSKDRFTKSILWTKCKFIFATSVGCFNSAIGLYSASTPLLRFERRRNYAVLDFKHEIYEPYEKINTDTFICTKRAKRFIRILNEKRTNLYIHFQLIPAFLQIPYLYNLDEIQLFRFFNIFLEGYDNYEEAYFLIEKYPLKPEFIYLLIEFMRNYEIENVFNYDNLTQFVFGGDVTASTIDKSEWMEKCNELLQNVSYDKNKTSHIETLLSLSKNGECMNYSKISILLATLVGVSMTKCFSFSPLLSCFFDTYSVKDERNKRKLQNSHSKRLAKRARLNDDEMIQDTNDENMEETTIVNEGDDNNNNDGEDKDDDNNVEDEEDYYEDDGDDNDEDFDINECGVNSRFILPECKNLSLIPECYRDVNYRNCDVKTMREIKDRTIEFVYGKKLSYFDMQLAKISIQLLMSAGFKKNIIDELIAMISTIYVPVNVNKKFLIFQGRQSTGKTYFCDLIMELNKPDVGRFLNIDKAVERSSFTTKCNVTIINEVQNISPLSLKSITGNDGESAQVFFSQQYNLQQNQSLMFGATNEVIKFINKDVKFMKIDHTSVQRLHAIVLDGAQVSEHDHKVNSFFEMTANLLFFKNIFNEELITMAKALGWIAFKNYFDTRDENLEPVLNENNECVKKYKHDVYYLNNILYAFLVDAGISEEDGFHMDTRDLIKTVKTFLSNQQSTKCPISKFYDFEYHFYDYYKQRIRSLKYINNFQYTAFIEHVKETMMVIEKSGKFITSEQLEKRLHVYCRQIERVNARNYFTRYNKRYYDNRTDTYHGITFVNESIKTYTLNECSSSISLPSSSSSNSSSSLEPSPSTLINRTRRNSKSRDISPFDSSTQPKTYVTESI